MKRIGRWFRRALTSARKLEQRIREDERAMVIAHIQRLRDDAAISTSRALAALAADIDRGRHVR